MTKRPKQPKPYRGDIMAMMRSDGWSCIDIAKWAGVSRQRVYQILAKVRAEDERVHALGRIINDIPPQEPVTAE